MSAPVDVLAVIEAASERAYVDAEPHAGRQLEAARDAVRELIEAGMEYDEGWLGFHPEDVAAITALCKARTRFLAVLAKVQP